jgi:CBS domain-containing protein
MLVKDIMTEEFETIPYDRTLDEALELMLGNRIDHVFVVEDSTPAAMITARKALIACYKTDAPVSEIPISGFSRGLETRVGPKESALICIGKLRRAKVDCLPVVEGISVEGVVTTDDVIDNLSNITEEMLREDDRRDEWTV